MKFQGCLLERDSSIHDYADKERNGEAIYVQLMTFR